VELAVDALEGLDAVLWARGPVGAHRALLDDVIARLDEHAPSHLALARALELRGLSSGAEGRVSDGIADCERADRIVAESGSAKPRRRALSRLRLVWALGHSRDVPRAMEVLEDAERRFVELDDTLHAAACSATRASLLQRLGRYVEAAASAREARTQYEELGSVRWLGVSWLRLATIARERCDLDDLRFAAERALRLHRQDPHFAYVEGIALTSLAAGEHAAGELVRARRRNAEVLPLHQSMGQHMLAGLTVCYDGVAAFEIGEVETGLELLEAGIDTLRRANAPHYTARFVLFRALLYALLGRGADARSMIEQARGAPALPGQAELASWIEALLLDGSVPAADATSVDLHIAARLLQRTTDAAEVTGHLAMRIEASGAYVVLPNAERVVLGPRSAAGRIMVRLAHARVSGAGEPVSSEALIAAGWPNGRGSEASARNRLYVTVRRLRDRGLAEVLRSVPGGYLLDPEIGLVWDRTGESS